MKFLRFRKPCSSIFYPRLAAPKLSIPLFGSKVPAGAFPSPADEYIEKLLDLNDLLAPNPIASLFFKASGESMRDANIFDGSICAVDRSLVPRHGHIVLAAVDGEFTVKRLRVIEGGIELHPANPAFKPMRFTEGQEVRIVGVVRGTVSTFAV
jgi:DNA polymerase V